MNDSTDSPRIPVRRIRFSYPTESVDRHFVGGDLVMSHVMAHLSSTFPVGEDFFVRTVRDAADQVTDPELRARVKGFIGQEVTHGREHRVLNERLQQLGYPCELGDRTTVWFRDLYESRLSLLSRLAFTAALEHFTACFAETLLTDERALALLGTTEVRSMLLWHAVEESEHRSVAIDVFRAVGGTERRRIASMRAITVLFSMSIVIHTIISLCGDRAARNPIRLARSLAALRRSPFMAPQVLRRVGSYNRRGFHPDDVDNTALLERWTTELFGEQGTLADHLA